MDDLISRQAAIDGINELMKVHFDRKFVLGKARTIMQELPSARPEIVRCKDCKYADDDGVCQNSIGLVIQDDDDFCSRAERREE